MLTSPNRMHNFHGWIMFDGIFCVVIPYSHWGCLTPSENERICREYGDCDIHFYERTFLVLGFCLPFSIFDIEVLNHMVSTIQDFGPLFNLQPFEDRLFSLNSIHVEAHATICVIGNRVGSRCAQLFPRC